MTPNPAADPLDVLAETLAIAVPLEMARLARLPDGHRDTVIWTLAARAGRLVSHHGDALQWPAAGRRARRYGGVRIDGAPGTAGVFTALIGGLAAAAFGPDGATFHGRHWCARPSLCTTCRGGAV
jgi:hypothetical protein